MRHRSLGATLALVGVAVVAVSLVGFLSAKGRPGPRAFGTAAAATTSATSIMVQPDPSPASPAPSTDTRPESATTPAPVLQAPPTSLTLTALHVSAPVVPVGVNGTDLQVPSNPAQVGWWVASAPAGSATGSTVIVGHVDAAATGPGALYGVGLGRLVSGDTIVLTTAGSASFSYRVYAQKVLVKKQGLPAAVFESGSQARLVLITCGGPFDRDHGSYLDNVVIYAAPIPQ